LGAQTIAELFVLVMFPEVSKLLDHAGWRTRGYLPHWDAAEAVQHVVFRLADSLPAKVLADLDRAPTELRLERAEMTLDKGLGRCALRDPQLARMVEDALRHFDCVRYRLHAWCVMPTHVHTLLAETEAWPLANVIHSWKSFTAHKASTMGRWHGRLWAREYFDRWMRDDAQADAARAYIEFNPVAAGLCARPEDWPWSSAHRRRDAGATCAP
jgi:putative transposase